MILAILLFLSGLSISAVAEYYSIMGLMAIFSAAPIPIAVMGIVLGIGKLVQATWLKAYWGRLPVTMRLYGVLSVCILMLITTLGCFGFLSKAHSDQTLVSGDVGSKIAIYDEKIKTSKENIDANRKALKQMDEAVDQSMVRSTDEKGADKAVAIRRSQTKERARLQAEIAAEQASINKLNEEAAPIRAEVRKVDAEVGPLKYIAAFIYGVNPDSNLLEKAVTWVIILIVVVFDPLAVVMLLAAQMTYKWVKEKDAPAVEEKPAEPIPEPVPEVTLDEVNAMLDEAREPAAEPDVTLLEKYQKEQERADAARAVAKLEVTAEEEEAFQALEPKPEPEKTAAELYPYLNQPFKHFENLTPLVAPVVENPVFVMPDANTPLIKPLQGEEAYELMKSIGIFTPDGKLAPEYGGEEEFEDDGVDEEQFLVDFDTNLARGHEDEVREVHAEFVPETPAEEPAILTLGIDEVERPGDYITPPPVEDPPRVLEAAPARGRGIMNTHLEADNLPELGKASRSDFGNNFPVSAEKGDVYLRTDYLPNRLFKFNGAKWIEVDKSQTDVYAYDELYIKHLIDEIAAGRYDADSLTDSERDNIAEYLKNNS
jgi:hypothetical protein